MQNRTICVIQHSQCEPLGIIEPALIEGKLAFQTFKTFDGQQLPKTLEGMGGLVLMGGPMGVYDQERNPHLREELVLVEQALKKGLPILGVCLGSQLLAAVLGAVVRKAPQKELGWHAVSLTDSATDADPLWNGVVRSFPAFHWHGDIFDLPEGAVPLASSALTECQAFRYGGAAYGILFHLEVTAAMLEGMLTAFADELREAGGKADAIRDAAKANLPSLHHIGTTVFHRWARQAKSQVE